MAVPWNEKEWSKGILLGLAPDPNTGYRATIWFEYTRALFNEIREGSLIAVRNFSDREPPTPTGQAQDRDRTYEEYSILQVDQVHPWHYAIQGPGDGGYPAFTVASAQNARSDWTQWDDQNRDDVSRIRCEAIPLRLAFKVSSTAIELPQAFSDRSKPMPGFEVRLLSPEMTDSIVNHKLDAQTSVEIGYHVVQNSVKVRISVPQLVALHFGVFGFTGAGKSNLLSTLMRLMLGREPSRNGSEIYKGVVFDLMDEYTGLLIDQLVQHQYSRIVVAGRNSVDELLLKAAIASAESPNSAETNQLIASAAEHWSDRITLPSNLRPYRDLYVKPLSRLIKDGKLVFYETTTEQGVGASYNIGDALATIFTSSRFGGSAAATKELLGQLTEQLAPMMQSAFAAEGGERDKQLNEVASLLQQQKAKTTTQTAQKAIDRVMANVRDLGGSRGALNRRVSTSAYELTSSLNFQPKTASHVFSPSLLVVIGENERAIATLARQMVENAFEDRRTRSLLHPAISFVFDEADVFISQSESDASVVEQATLLARRGRKFGLGLGIATQRIRYLDTSIMAQPHTYFISKLPRKTDREAIAEAFAISEESLEQSFSFTPGQWLVASHDATGLKGTPFPVKLPNADRAVLLWLRDNQNG
ncbi:MAG: ATP-binding protein [Pirellulaceae bacterium]